MSRMFFTARLTSALLSGIAKLLERTKQRPIYMFRLAGRTSGKPPPFLAGVDAFARVGAAPRGPDGYQDLGSRAI
jgi:hypothetical protein